MSTYIPLTLHDLKTNKNHYRETLLGMKNPLLSLAHNSFTKVNRLHVRLLCLCVNFMRKNSLKKSM